MKDDTHQWNKNIRGMCSNRKWLVWVDKPEQTCSDRARCWASCNAVLNSQWWLSYLAASVDDLNSDCSTGCSKDLGCSCHSTHRSDKTNSQSGRAAVRAAATDEMRTGMKNNLSREMVVIGREYDSIAPQLPVGRGRPFAAAPPTSALIPEWP